MKCSFNLVFGFASNYCFIFCLPDFHYISHRSVTWMLCIQAGDLCHCAEICQQLMERRHGVGWMAAQRLALSADFPDLAMKKKLIAFALIHCPDTNIYELLDTRSKHKISLYSFYKYVVSSFSKTVYIFFL